MLGNLTVYSGDIEVDAGGLIEGSVTSWSGDLQVDGRVGGSVTMMSGDVELGDSAMVDGDISVVKGNIQQRAGAAVGGSLLRGPQLQFSAPALFVGAPNAPVAPVEPETWAERLFGFMGKVLLALVLFALIVGGAVAVAGLRPHWVVSVHETLRQQIALSFAVGLMVNVLASAFIGLLFITVCLRPPGLLLGLLLAGANVVGLAAVGHEIGNRLAPKMGGTWHEWSRVGVGAAVPVGVIMLLWLFGWCFTFFAWLGALIVGRLVWGRSLCGCWALAAGCRASRRRP
ncbi:MAG: polymer-forming cytoskeletal protein [Anaerolineales bacterium]|nr:polymer-forming cytoskeletal protein [Anaerolineales bacterium]